MDTQVRCMKDRRNGKDRRKLQMIKQLFARDPHQRGLQPRRTEPERRNGWIRLTRWSSIDLERFKIFKYLRPY